VFGTTWAWYGDRSKLWGSVLHHTHQEAKGSVGVGEGMGEGGGGGNNAQVTEYVNHCRQPKGVNVPDSLAKWTPPPSPAGSAGREKGDNGAMFQACESTTPVASHDALTHISGMRRSARGSSSTPGYRNRESAAALGRGALPEFDLDRGGPASPDDAEGAEVVLEARSWPGPCPPVETFMVHKVRQQWEQAVIRTTHTFFRTRTRRGACRSLLAPHIIEVLPPPPTPSRHLPTPPTTHSTHLHRGTRHPHQRKVGVGREWG
jgi:hypothetical protein